jgi:hypothetical protein
MTLFYIFCYAHDTIKSQNVAAEQVEQKQSSCEADASRQASKADKQAKQAKQSSPS